MSPLRLFGRPRRLVPVTRPRQPLGSAGGRSQAHRGQTGAGAGVVSRPGGQPQPVTGDGHGGLTSELTPGPGEEAAAASLTQSSPVERVKFTGDGRRRLASVELLGA